MEYSEEELYQLYAKSIYRYIFSLCGEADTAEELTQETFYLALKNLHTFRGESSPQVWLCAIAKRLWYKELARRKRLISTQEAIFPPSPEGNPAEDFMRHNDRLALYYAMQRLAPETREVIYLRLAGDFSFRDIGAILGRSEIWARMRFYRGKEELARMLGGKGK